MTEEKKNNDIEQVSDVSSLISLCQRTDNMPVIQKLALKQKVAFHFEYTLHSYMRNEGAPSSKFATYISLLETKPEYYGNVCEILVDNFVSEAVVEECLLYIRSGIIPYHLWTDKLVHDLKESFYYNQASIGGLLTVYLGKTLKASLIAFNKAIKVLEEEFCQEFSYEDNPNAGRLGIKKEDDKWKDVKDGIAFVKARALEMPQELKEKYMKAFSTNDEGERVAFQENETTIFTETLIDMLKYPFNQKVIEKMQAGTATPFEDFWETPMFGGGSTLVSYARGNGDTMQQSVGEQQEQQGGMGSWLRMLGYGPNGETPEEMARRRELAERQAELLLDEDEEMTPNMRDQLGLNDVGQLDDIRPRRVISNEKDVQYCVKKVARDGSERVMSENWFPTEKQAQEFVKEVTESNPAMAKAFEFKIEAGVRS